MRRFAVLCWLIAFVAQPAWAASSASLQPLERQLLITASSSKPRDVGIAALDLRTGERVAVNGDEPFPMASVVKIAVAANYLAQIEHGRRSFTDTIAGKSVVTLMEAMMTHSDNFATDLLIRDLGGPGTVQAWLNQQGIRGIRIDRNIDQLLRAQRDLYDVRDSSTPDAMVNFLQRLDSGQLLKPLGKSYLLGLMGRCLTGKNRIRGLLPPGAKVENKTGTLNGLSADVGFMTLPNGRRIAVAFFARGGTNRPRTIAQAAKAIYDGFTMPAMPAMASAFRPIGASTGQVSPLRKFFDATSPRN